MFIKRVEARVIPDSRGQETIEVSVNNCEPASSPSGKSTGRYETKQYYKSLKFNVDFLNKWNKWLEVHDFSDLEFLENAIVDKLKLKNVKEFGANALYAFESAVLKALAKSERRELWEVVNPHAKKFPRPAGNCVGGGLHSENWNNHPVFQEFLLIPKEETFEKNVKVMKDAYNLVGRKLKATEVNDEGAWQTSFDDEAVLKILSGLKNVEVGTDIAASSFYKKRLYDYKHTERTRPAHIEHIIKLVKNYEVFYVEDPVQEEDFEGFAEMKKNCKESIIVGDDLTVTHIDRLAKALEGRSINAMIIKPNQNGSLLEVKQVVELCKKHGIQTVMSHRSGETLDTGLADYAFAFQTDFIKCGIATKWRETKLNRMIEIEKSF